MRVWLVQATEPMPLPGLGNRLWRTWITGDLLVEEGHEVVRWSSTYCHSKKHFLAKGGEVLQINPRYQVRFLEGLGYQKHISLQRLRDHRHVAREFRKAIAHQPPPDIILASFPQIEICAEAIRYGGERNIPVVVDVRDQWPDLFYDAFPSSLRGLIQLLCTPIRKEVTTIFRNATAITGNAQEAVEWGLRYGGRPRSEYDRSFPMAYAEMTFTPQEIQEAEMFWRQYPQVNDPERFVIAYTGAIGQTLDFETILEAARRLNSQPVQFVLCGAGDALKEFQEQARNAPNVLFTGWVEAAKIQWLLRRANLGLVPYKDLDNFTQGITNKPIEYLSHALPLLTTQQRGSLREALEANHCGIYYRSGQPEELAARVSEMLAAPDQRERLACNARALYERDFSAHKVYRGFVDLLEALHQRRAGYMAPAPGQSRRDERTDTD